MASQSFDDLCSMKYGDQAVWFLNGFWSRGIEEQAEVVFGCYQLFVELDDAEAEAGKALDEFKSHVVLERVSEPLTVVEMRKRLKTIDQNSDGKMALLEYLLYRYKFTVEEVVNAPQGDNSEEVDRARALFDTVMEALTAQRAVLAELEQAQAELAAAEAELQAAQDDLNAQEEAYHGAIATAEAKANDDNLGVVKRNRAAAELAQLRAEDPLPLRRAKLTSDAALRKVGKEKKKVDAKVAEAAEKQADLEAKLDEASAELKRAQASGGTSEGTMWFLHKQEYIADSYLPRSKQKFDHPAVREKVDLRPPEVIAMDD